MNVIELCKQEYITRLFNRNPLLHFGVKTTKSSDQFCLTDLFNNKFLENDKQLSLLKTNSPALSLLQGLLNNEITEIKHPDKSLVVKLLKQKTSAKELMHMTGQHSLYIGYPLLYVPIEGKVPVLAPLLLIPVEVSAQADKITVDRIKQHGDVVPIIVNPLLAAWCKQYEDITITWEEIVQKINQNTDDEKTNNIATLFSYIEQTTQSWHKLNEIQLSPLPEFESAPNNQLVKKWAESKLPPRIVHSAVLGIVKYSGCALLQDLEKLSGTQIDHLGILKALVTQRITQQDEAATANDDTNSWHVVATDPSQKSTIDQAGTSPWMVIQGPPGTGKSQTIVNLIAQALANKQTVALFCEKPSALEVVKKRLAAVNLDELTLLVKKPSEQRLEVVKGIKNINIDWEDLYQNQRPDFRNNQAAKIVELERDIDQSMQGFYPKEKEGIKRYANVRARLQHLERDLGSLRDEPRHHSLVRAISDFSLDQSRDARWFDSEWGSKVKQWKKTAAECDFATSPWREHHVDATLNIFELRKALGHIQNFQKTETNAINIRQTHWFFAHSWMRGSYALSFFNEKQRSAQESLCRAVDGLGTLRHVLKKHQHKPSIDALYARAPLRYLEPIWLNSLGQASDVQQLLKDLATTTLGKVLLDHYPDTPEQWPAQLEAAACTFWIKCWEQEYSSIYSSVSPLKRKIEQLQTLLVEKQSLDANVLRNEYRNRLKYRNQLASYDLLRERSGRNASKTQIRDLMTQGWSNTKKLHPILLTTPEVACQILPLKAELFDWVIIDEASQMFTAEALPLIYRGRRIVVAGDNKQMPPSNFFASSTNSEDEDGGDIADEIIETKEPTLIPALDNACLLDAAESVLAKGAHAQKLLNIHYRSNFRELIEFSNHAFYEGELQAPPGNPASQGVLSRPIIFKQVTDATFDKGINEREAQAIVQTILELWRQPQSPSLGVIVMNAQQKMRIEDLLREAAETENLSERLESERERQDKGEDVGFFIRNVENVQGDEREVIILGATYAGDSRRFGPLTTTAQGRRRLNVAITRAKQGMVVFSSLKLSPHSSDETINDSWYFLAYLRYAKAVYEGKIDEIEQLLDRLNPKRTVQRGSSLFDSDFELDVANFLAQHGYKTEPQAPESGFRIDLAVKCEDRLGYLCGIECDGAAFHSSWTARSRDIWRQKILEAKGWNIYRIWSTNWFNDPQREQEKLLTYLNLRKQLQLSKPLEI